MSPPIDPALADFACPEALPAPRLGTSGGEPPHLEARWQADSLARLGRHLETRGGAALAALGDEELLAAWEEAVAELLDPASASRRALDPVLAASLGYSSPLLQASLEAMLGGFRGPPARRVVERAAELERHQRGLVLGVLAGNVPGLAVQVALPALAARRPLLLKSSRREPLLAAALARLLARARPELGDAVAAATWQGGDHALEEGLLETARTVVAFGSRATLDDLDRRHARLLARGPMLSVAVVGSAASPAATAVALAEDIALFEQRGCLSVRAIYVEATHGDDRLDELGRALVEALDGLAERWPPPRLEPSTTAAVQQARREAEMRDQRVLELDILRGTVIVESEPTFRLLPPARAVRLHPVASLDQLEEILAPLAGRIQGAALAGDGARAAIGALERLGVGRIAPAGSLQRPDATWANGERHLVEELGAAPPC